MPLRPVSAGPPASLLEKMRQRQAALGSLVAEKSAAAVAALSSAESAFPSHSEAAAVSAAVRTAASRRAQAGVFLPDELEGDEALVSASYSRSPRVPGTDKAIERRSRTFVGLNFCR